ncbi:hypothetical protein [Myxococcus sp. Y35]|uniref:hypothetical protein n=1 Tax=Pseudomyxococcus flavus TaxID=3115648 RepID=UPI003CF57A3A
MRPPRGHVDGVALRSLLLRRQFEELTQAVEQLQWGMEANPQDEHWMTDGMQALGNGSPDSTELLDAWVVASPLKAEAPVDDTQPEAPEDFRAVQQRDYALARERRFKEILPLWDAFLARNPDHGLAYLERSGTHFHLRDLKAALADLKKACDLGVNKGCARARHLERARPAAR